jgi:hypothetical protein
VEGTGHTVGSLPLGTEGVIGTFNGDGLRSILDAASTIHTVPVVAGSTLSVGIPVSAVVTDGSTDLICIEVEPDWALDTGVLLPLGASVIGGGGSSNHAATIGWDGISSIAVLADAHVRVELLAVLVHHAAHSVLVENVAWGTLGAVSVGPGLTSEIVVDELDEVGVVVLGTQRREGLGSVDLGEVDGLGEGEQEQHRQDNQMLDLAHGNNKINRLIPLQH